MSEENLRKCFDEIIKSMKKNNLTVSEVINVSMQICFFAMRQTKFPIDIKISLIDDITRIVKEQIKSEDNKNVR